MDRFDTAVTVNGKQCFELKRGVEGQRKASCCVFINRQIGCEGVSCKRHCFCEFISSPFKWGLGGGEVGQKIFLQFKTPPKSRASYFSSAYYCKHDNYKGNNCSLYILIFHRQFYEWLKLKSMALLIHSTVNILKYSTLSSEINVISCDSSCYFFQCFFFFSLLIWNISVLSYFCTESRLKASKIREYFAPVLTGVQEYSGK